ncbi:hypothetical protein [Methylobacterium sp. Leaf87]|uniref:hypothetical protein n=1 Tax=Methylobacterium sp. Leaf87 TaxID=1736243 RepID=UPI000A855335|nr:hypothetical protein [Methylobacterium sp. Leaf87]
MAKSSSRTKIKLRDVALQEIGILVDQIDKLPSVMDAAEHQAVSADVNKVFRAVGEAAGLEEDDARSIFNVLQNILLLSEKNGSVGNAIEILHSGLPEELGKKFLTSRERLEKAASKYDRSNPVSLSIKAQRLAYLRERLYQGAEITTDIRPIFTPDASEIADLVITHELSVKYFEGVATKSIHLSLDNADLVELREACDRALLKSKTLERTFKDKWSIEALGDETDR